MIFSRFFDSLARRAESAGGREQEICLGNLSQDKPGAARFPSLPPPHPRPRSDEANTVQRANPRSLHHGCYHVALRGGRGARGACARFPDDRQPPPFFARSCWVGSQEEALDGLRPPLLTFASLLSNAGRGRGRGRGRGARRRGVGALRRYQGTHTSVAVCLSPRMIDRRPPLPVGFKIPARLLTARHPPLQIETAPFDPRFPQQNQAKHCYTRYNEFHK